MSTKLPAVSLIVDGCHGVYVPKRFVEIFDMPQWSGITPDDIECLSAGPDHENYWETWDDVLSKASYAQDGYKWTLHQDGDLFVICPELMDEDQKYNFGFYD